MHRRKIEDFEIGDTIGVGTVGTIMCARDKRNDLTVALKILHPTVADDELIKARFGREMMILEKLSHPNIIEYFGGGRIEQQLFYAMELVDGGTMKDILANGPLPWREAATAGYQICSALQYAHNHGIIHRDLKPANLLLTPDGELKLGDFGVARDTTSPGLTNQGLTVGTYAYMSPEQIGGRANVSGKADLYAVGCLLFEMLTARPPFEGDTIPQLFDQHLRDDPPRVRDFAPECPVELEELIVQSMSKSPEDRPFSARAVQGILMEMLEDHAKLVDTAADVGADDALSRGRAELGDRVRQTGGIIPTRPISWLSLAALLLVIFGVVCVAACFGV